MYSIDRKSSFKAVANVLEDLRQENCHVPIILCGNKIDLERKRTVMTNEVKNVASTFGVAHFEISVALNHDVDDLLIGIVAEIKESYKTERVPDENKPLTVSLINIY
jgi:GTPase SAR1 family protein